MERIKIVHFFRFIVEVEKPYSQEDLPKSFTYTLRDLDMEEVNHMIELAVDAINGLSLKPKDVLKVSLEEPAVLSRGSETEPEFLKEGVAEDDLTTKIASIIDETIIDYELITSLEEITHDTLEPSKLKIEEIKSNEKTSINQKCRELINANSTDQLAIALNTVNLAKGKTNNEKWLNDTVFKVFFECVDIDKEQVVFLDGVTFAYMRKESLNERSSVNLEKYKDAQTIFCSFNRDDYHWLTAILHKPSKSVVLVDSMAVAPKEVLIKDGRVFLNKIWSFANIDESDLSQYKLHLLTSPNQNNTYDCGVFTIMNIYQLMNKYELHLDQTDANNFRYFICKTIFEKKGIEY